MCVIQRINNFEIQFTKMSTKKFGSKKILKIVSIVLLSIIAIIALGITWIVINKDIIIDKAIHQANKGYQGVVRIEQVDISPLRSFPYISIELKKIKVYESKNTDTVPIVDVDHAYIGFDFEHIMKKEFIIKKIALENGKLNIVQYEDGAFNITKAFTPIVAVKEDTTLPFTLSLKKIELKNIDIKKKNLATNILIEADIQQADAGFKKTEKDIHLNVDGAFVLNVFKNDKPTYVYHKHLELHTDFVYHTHNEVIDLKKTSVIMEGVDFNLSGKVDFKDEMNVDLKLSGNKPNFDLFIAFAPEDLIPTLRSYDNKGKVYFDAHVKGKTANNQTPAIVANFGCKDGYIKNPEANRALDQLGFHCSFTNGNQRNASTSTFELKDFTARPEAGKFKANLKVKNFEAPEIDMQLDSDFNLEFLTKFLKLKDLRNLTGQVLLTMNFHDIIDLQHPEKALEKFNQAYYSKLVIKDLNFKSDSYHLPIKNLNVDAMVTGQQLDVTNFSLNLGDNDIAVKGKVSNIPAVLHKTGDSINAELHVRSNRLDFKTLMPKSNEPSAIDEILSDLKFDLTFKGKANTFITSKSLPIGKFYITNISANLNHYHHQLDGFNGIFYVNERDVLIKKLDGQIDRSDFHFTGKIGHYDLWLADVKRGNTEIDFDLTSNEIHFKDILSYKGINFVPEEYRNEDIKNLKLHGHVSLHYDSILKSSDFYLTEFNAKLKIHPLRFHSFHGNIHFEKDILKIKDFSGHLGNNDFKMNGIYHLGKSAAVDQMNFESKRLNINEIITYNPPPANTKIDHDSGHNLFADPFPNLIIKARINELTYNKYYLSNIIGQLSVKENHYIYLDKLQFQAAKGLIEISGYFNGSNPNKIYLSPDIKLQKVDIDQLFIKLDNLGQDMLVSENVHGLLTGRIKGKIRLHTDLTPIINESDLQIDMMIEDGRLDNFAPIQAMASFFSDKNLKRIKFDKLENRFTLKNGQLSFPNMNINSSLGFLEISGSQTVDLDMDYYVRVPLKLVGKVAFSKLFNRNPKEISAEQEDELIIRDPKRRTRFINIRLLGTPDDYKISLQKSKDVKAGIEFTKTDDFLFEDIESEFEEN